MDRYDELVKLLKVKGVNFDAVEIYHDNGEYELEVTYTTSKGVKSGKWSQTYKTIEAAAVELIGYYSREF